MKSELERKILNRFVLESENSIYNYKQIQKH